MTAPDLEKLRDDWQALWPKALAAWSKYVQLSAPRWCFTAEDEKEQGLSDSFAMIRLTDQAIVISLPRVLASGVEKFGREVMAHEIGHHVYVPANLLDQGRLIARVRRGLPTKEHLAPLVANLYADLLLNDRLQRSAGLDLAGVYRALAGSSTERMWTFYMRIYEILWRLPRGSLAAVLLDPHYQWEKKIEIERPVAVNLASGENRIKEEIVIGSSAQIEGDAQLAARIIRSYARDWLDGAGRFALLCLPYLLEDDGLGIQKALGAWLDTRGAGKGMQADAIPAGLAELDEVEVEGAVHPADDAQLTGLGVAEESDEEDNPQEEPELTTEMEGPTRARAEKGGHRRYRDWRGPLEYGQLLRSMGAVASEQDIVIRYYRERAIPYLVPFPVRPMPQASEPLPEGLERWDFGMPLEDADWLQSVLTSPVVVPGLTTVQRTHGSSPGSDPEKRPIDLYLGVDCSGSMLNPRYNLSYPVLAGAVIALSALRASARVMVVLSGEPGQSVSTDGFVTQERKVLEVLTGYLGTGYTFGIHRLADTFTSRKPNDRAVHILIVTDHDIFAMLAGQQTGEDGWGIAREAAVKARGGAGYVLNMPENWEAEGVARMKADGWDVHHVQNWEELLSFARVFSRAHYGEARVHGA
jgi:hypothetical protein